MTIIKGVKNPFRDKQLTEYCSSDTLIYSKLWPVIFLFSALTDIPMPLPKGNKPGQHRDWGWLPILVVICISGFMYYGYLCHIVLVLLWRLNCQTQAIVYFVPFNILFIFFLISYGRIVSQTPGHAKDTDFGSSSERPSSILGDTKWCYICRIWKPDRAHHCHVCDTCVLKMDHHCPWVNGCIGILNYRYYIQFLFYVTILGSWLFSTALAAFVQFDSLSTFDGIALCVLIVGGILTFILGAFTMSHIWLVLCNRTTIENSKFQKWKKARKSGKSQDQLLSMFTETGKNVFDQGYVNNWLEVMGEQKLLWFLPFSSKQDIDGIHFGYNYDTLIVYNHDKSAGKIEELKPNAI